MAIIVRRTANGVLFGVLAGRSDPLAVDPDNIRITLADVEAHVEVVGQYADGRDSEAIRGGVKFTVLNMGSASIWFQTGTSFPLRRLDEAALDARAELACIDAADPVFGGSEIAPDEEIQAHYFLFGKRENWPEPVTGSGYVMDVTLYDRNGKSFVVSSELFRIELR